MGRVTAKERARDHLWLIGHLFLELLSGLGFRRVLRGFGWDLGPLIPAERRVVKVVQERKLK